MYYDILVKHHIFSMEWYCRFLFSYKDFLNPSSIYNYIQCWYNLNFRFLSSSRNSKDCRWMMYIRVFHEKSYRASKSLIDLSFPPSGDCQSMFFFFLSFPFICEINNFACQFLSRNTKQHEKNLLLFFSFLSRFNRCQMSYVFYGFKRKHRNL